MVGFAGEKNKFRKNNGTSAAVIEVNCFDNRRAGTGHKYNKTIFSFDQYIYICIYHGCGRGTFLLPPPSRQIRTNDYR